MRVKTSNEQLFPNDNIMSPANKIDLLTCLLQNDCQLYSYLMKMISMAP